jgi:hypothetical protein
LNLKRNAHLFEEFLWRLLKLVWEHLVSDTRKQIEAEITAFKLEIERLKSLAKKRMGQPRDLEDVTRQLRELHVRLSQLERNWRQTT